MKWNLKKKLYLYMYKKDEIYYNICKYRFINISGLADLIDYIFDSVS